MFFVLKRSTVIKLITMMIFMIDWNHTINCKILPVRRDYTTKSLGTDIISIYSQIHWKRLSLDIGNRIDGYLRASKIKCPYYWLKNSIESKRMSRRVWRVSCFLLVWANFYLNISEWKIIDKILLFFSRLIISYIFKLF